MPFSMAHYYLQFGGDIADEEIWSNGIRLANPGGAGSLDQATIESDVLADVATLLTVWIQTAGNGWSSRVKLRYIKLNRVGTDGLYADGTTTNAWFDDVPPYPTGPAASTLANSTAMVLSWTTAAERGPAARGRIFMAVPGLALEAATGRWTQSSLPAIATGAKTFLNGLKAQTEMNAIGLVPCVMSKVGAGTTRPITGVRVGNVPDTMRSRRNALVEAYSSVAL